VLIYINKSLFSRISLAFEIKMNSKSDQSDELEKKYALYENITTSITVTNAHIFFIADKKGMFLIIHVQHINTFIL